MQYSNRTHLRTELSQKIDFLADSTLTLIVAPGGYGKTTLAKYWRERLNAEGRTVAWLTLSGLHADLIFLLEDIVDALRIALPPRKDHEPAFGEAVERLLTNRIDLRGDRLARELARELRSLPVAPILILDGFEALPREGPSLEFVDALLHLDPCPVRLVLTTRGTRPEAATRLLASGHALAVNADDLNLRTEQLRAILEDAQLEPDPELVANLLARSEGWAIAVRLTVRALSQIPRADRLRFVRESGSQQDLFDYVATDLVGRVSSQVVSVLEMCAVLGPCTRAMLSHAAALEDGGRTLAEATDAGLLIAEGNELAVHDLWREWLGERMRNRAGGADWRAAHERAGFARSEAGQRKRALRHFVAALPKPGLENRIIEVLADRGDSWISQGHRQVVERSLAVISQDRRKAMPELVALDGLLLSGSDPDRAIRHLKNAAAAFHEARNYRAELMCLHELAVIAVNENRVGAMRSLSHRAFRLQRILTDPRLRGVITMGLGGAAMLAGRNRIALRLTDIARTFDHHPRERGGIGVIQATIFFQMGDWDEGSKRIQALLAIPEQRQHGLSYHALQVIQAWMDVPRGANPDAVRARLEAASEAFEAAHHTLNQTLAAIGLARLDQSLGNDEAAALNLERAEALATSVGFLVAAAAAAGGLARVLQRQGQFEQARNTAFRSLSGLDQAKQQSAPRGLVVGAASSVALACCVLADLGEAEHAMTFLDRHRSDLENRELPLQQHALLTCVARTEDRTGRRAASEKTLREAWQFAEKADLAFFSPDLDPELLEWSTREARAIGLKGTSLDRCLERFQGKAAAPFVLRSLGGLAVEREGRRVSDRTWRGATPRRLLMRLLVAEGQALTRERIESDLWPDMTSRRASNNLRVAISRLRDVLEPRRRRVAETPLLDLEGDRIGLTDEAMKAWDITLWRQTLHQACEATTAGDEGAAITAARLLTEMSSSEFLPESYDDWVLDYRRSLERTLVEIGRRLSESWRARGAFGAARGFAQLVLIRVPADERSWELLIAALLDSGDRSGARRAYQEAEVQLRRELDREPGVALRALAESL